MALSVSDPPEEGVETRPPPPEEESSWLRRATDVVIWLAVAAALMLAFWPRSSGPQEGKPAAALELPVVEAKGRGAQFGEKPELRSIPGALERPLLIEAFASWCGACRRTSGTLEELRPAQTAGKLDVIAISVDDDARKALQAKTSWPINVEVLHDEAGEFSRSYQVDVLPTYILVGTDGTVKRVTAGIAGASDVRAWLAEAEK